MVGRPAAVGQAVVGRPAVKNYLFLVYSTITNIRDKFPARRGGGTLPPTNGSVGQKKHPYGESPFPLTGALTGKPPYGDPLRADRLTGRSLTGTLLTGDTFNYRKAYGNLQGGILQELGGNFRLCAVNQKRPFFLRVGPLLDLLPFKRPFPLTGALTGRPPYGKASYGEASYGKTPKSLIFRSQVLNFRSPNP